MDTVRKAVVLMPEDMREHKIEVPELQPLTSPIPSGQISRKKYMQNECKDHKEDNQRDNKTTLLYQELHSDNPL